ncbi:MAG: bacillithiol biosynthesis BshC, partial [Thermoanaerobaculia bacterium]
TLMGSKQGLDRALAGLEGDDFVEPVRQRVEEALGELRPPDPDLQRPLEKTREQILRALDTFAEKATSAAARRNETLNRRVQQLRESCLPLGRPQERVVASAHFQGKYGGRLVQSFWEQMGLDPRVLQITCPDCMEPTL